MNRLLANDLHALSALQEYRIDHDDDVEQALPALTCPYQLIAGNEDTLAPYAEIVGYASQLPAGTLVTLTGLNPSKPSNAATSSYPTSPTSSPTQTPQTDQQSQSGRHAGQRLMKMSRSCASGAPLRGRFPLAMLSAGLHPPSSTPGTATTGPWLPLAPHAAPSTRHSSSKPEMTGRWERHCVLNVGLLQLALLR